MEKKTSKIENFFTPAHTPFQKRSSSSLSPSEQSQLPKKMNMETIEESILPKGTETFLVIPPPPQIHH